jgi:Calx-beta domain
MRALLLFLAVSLVGCPAPSSTEQDGGSRDTASGEAPFDAPGPVDGGGPPDDAGARTDASMSDAPDAPPVVAIGDLRVTEGTGAPTSHRIPITITPPAPREVTVDVRAIDGSAESNLDYVLPTDTLPLRAVIPAGASSVEVTFVTNSESLDEDDETFSVQLSNVTGGALLGRSEATVTIVDDDEATYRLVAPGPSAVLSVAEGSAASSGRAMLGLARDAAARDGTIRVRAVPVEADASDFVPYDRTFTFPAGGESSTDLAIDLVGDAVAEPDETFRVEIVDAVGGVIGASSSVLVTITNDDPPEISGCASRSVTEGDTGRIRFDFVLTSNVPAPPGVRVLFTIGGTASRGSDYELVGFSTMTSGVDFAVGATSAVVSIDVVNDTAVEINETITLALIGASGAAGATLSPSCTLSTLTIVEDDPF